LLYKPSFLWYNGEPKAKNGFCKKGMDMGKRILIVDDALFLRMVLKDILVRNGYDVVGEAVNGIDAIEKYKELKPDLVTLDITMPDMTGLEAIKEIREFDRQAKVIMCSAMGQNLMVADAIKKGALDFIVKPFKEKAVLDVLKKWNI